MSRLYNAAERVFREFGAVAGLAAFAVAAVIVAAWAKWGD
jgi:hypothetical protein